MCASYALLHPAGDPFDNYNLNHIHVSVCSAEQKTMKTRLSAQYFRYRSQTMSKAHVYHKRKRVLEILKAVYCIRDLMHTTKTKKTGNLLKVLRVIN